MLLYLILVKVRRDSDGALDEHHEGEEAPVHGDHPLTFPRDATAAQNCDENEQGRGQDDDEPGDLIDGVGEEREELAPVNQGPEADTEAAEAEHEQEYVVAVEAELEASEREGAPGSRPLALVGDVLQPRPVIAVVWDRH